MTITVDQLREKYPRLDENELVELAGQFSAIAGQFSAIEEARAATTTTPVDEVASAVDRDPDLGRVLNLGGSPFTCTVLVGEGEETVRFVAELVVDADGFVKAKPRELVEEGG